VTYVRGDFHNALSERSYCRLWLEALSTDCNWETSFVTVSWMFLRSS